MANFCPGSVLAIGTCYLAPMPFSEVPRLHTRVKSKPTAARTESHKSVLAEAHTALDKMQITQEKVEEKGGN